MMIPVPGWHPRVYPRGPRQHDAALAAAAALQADAHAEHQGKEAPILKGG